MAKVSSKPYLVKVGLQEMNLLGRAQQTRPELFLQLLLAQHQLNLTGTVVHFAVVGIDLGEQVQRHVVLDTLLGGASERHIVRGDLEICFGLGHVGGLDVHIEIVTLSLRAGGALGPCD